MFYKGIIFDLDNTLYDYDLFHNKALHLVFDFIHNNFNIDYEHIKNIYDTSVKNVKNEIINCHNRCIYFKYMCLKLNFPLKYINILDKLYWKYVLENIKPFNKINKFIEWNKKMGIKIGILTDFQLTYQLKKLEKLNLIDHIDSIVSSEEVGMEKPSKKMFKTILDELGLKCHEVIMIGDNFEKDIQGAINNNILPFYLNNFTEICEKSMLEQRSGFIEFNNYNVLHEYLLGLKQDIDDLVWLSKRCGECFELTQANGGNISIKYDNLLIIKASGVLLGDVSESSGYVILNSQNKILNNYGKASIETDFHWLLSKYTIHLHPIVINKLLVQKDFVLNFPNSKIIEYETPGSQLCEKIKQSYDKNTKFYFLKNHGIIITCNNYFEILNLLNEITDYFNINIDNNIISEYIYQVFKKHVLTLTFSERQQSELYGRRASENAPHLTETIAQSQIDQLKQLPVIPDEVVHCGIVLFCINLIDIKTYYNKYHQLPKVIVWNNVRVYIIGETIKQCKNTEELLKTKLRLVSENNNYLNETEIDYLMNWEAEKFRLNQ